MFYCILMTSHKLSEDSKVRMDTMVRTNDGFEIAEVDLNLRGPGNLMGTQQSGVLNLRIADIVKDSQLLKAARKVAIETLTKDPSLKSIENLALRNTYQQISKNSTIWVNIS